MALSDVYRQQVVLLIRVIPFVAEEQTFALKGGTTINLFVRNMPRLSVDIDLTYLPVQDRKTSLANIDAAMRRIADRIRKGMPGSKVILSILPTDKIVSKIVVRAGGVQIKIEVTPVLRGSVYDPVMMTVSEAVEESFGFAETQVVSFADLYAGKIRAARQLGTFSGTHFCETWRDKSNKPPEIILLFRHLFSRMTAGDDAKTGRASQCFCEAQVPTNYLVLLE